MIAELLLARALHRQDDAPGSLRGIGRRLEVADRLGERAVLRRIGRGIVEADVERDDSRAERLQGLDEVGVRLARQRIAAVLRDRRVIERDDRDLVLHLRRRQVDGLVVDRGLKRGVEELGRERHGAQEDGKGSEPGHDGALARLSLREHNGRRGLGPLQIPRLERCFTTGRRQIMALLARSSTPRSTRIDRA